MVFWRRHAEHFLGRQPYAEAAAQLIFMAFLKRIVNGGARVGLSTIGREYAVGAGRIWTCDGPCPAAVANDSPSS